MHILNVNINWNIGYRNDPKVHFLVDRVPENHELIYVKKDHFYYAELDGYVNFYYYKSPGNGFGGTKISLDMEDGTKKVLVGPWFSNSEAVNSVGLGACSEVGITADSASFKARSGLHSGAVTLEVLKDAVAFFLPELHLVKKGGFYSPSLSSDSIIKPESE